MKRDPKGRERREAGAGSTSPLRVFLVPILVFLLIPAVIGLVLKLLLP